MNRREFSWKWVMASSILSASPLVKGFSSYMAPAPRCLKKGNMWGCIRAAKTVMEKFQMAKQAGFEGIEVMSHLNREDVLRAREETGYEGWTTVEQVLGGDSLECLIDYRERLEKILNS